MDLGGCLVHARYKADELPLICGYAIDFQWMSCGPCMDILWVSLDALWMLHRCSMDVRCTFNGVRCILKG